MKHKDDLKLTWLSIKQILWTKKSDSFTEFLTANGNVITESSRIAEEFNNYFINIPQELVDKIPHTQTTLTSFLSTPNMNSLALHVYPTSMEEILPLSRSLKVTHGAGTDDLDPYLISPVLDLIVKSLAAIINCSFSNGIIPDKLKIAKVIPIYKQTLKDAVNKL